MRRIKENQDIRDRITAAGLFDWQLAQKVNIAYSTLCVWLREPLPAGSERRERIERALNELEGKADGPKETRW